MFSKAAVLKHITFIFYLRLAIFITWPSELLCTVAFCAALLAYVCRLHMHHTQSRSRSFHANSVTTRKQFMQKFLDPLRKKSFMLIDYQFWCLLKNSSNRAGTEQDWGHSSLKQQWYFVTKIVLTYSEKKIF